MPRKAVPALVVGSVIVCVGGGIVDPMLDLQTDPEEWVDQDSQVIEDIGILKDEVKSSSELGIYVQSDAAFSDESVAFVHDLAVSSLDESVELPPASSLHTTVSILIEIPGPNQLPPLGHDTPVERSVG